MTDLYIFRLVDLFCSLPNIKVDPGNNPFVEEYLKLHRKYLRIVITPFCLYLRTNCVNLPKSVAYYKLFS